MGRALVLALDLGLTRRARPTVAGMLLARALLAAAAVPASSSTSPMLEMPMTNPPRRPDSLDSSIAGMVAFYDRQLVVPEVRDASNAGAIRDIRETLLLIADEDRLSRAEVALVLLAQRHQLTGITAIELGYPADPEHDAAVHTTLTTTGQLLQPYATLHGPQVQRVVNDLAEGHAPRDAGDMATLLALALHGIPRPQRPPAQA
ncbi:hypothetical protein DEMA109039_02195 [Deinococcus marmoris]